jgi:MinD superfamily P-loop ATPase
MYIKGNGVFRIISLQIDPDLCQLCQRCLAAKSCRTKAIIQIDPGEMPYLEADRCRGCWFCLSTCPTGAIQKLNKDV